MPQYHPYIADDMPPCYKVILIHYIFPLFLNMNVTLLSASCNQCIQLNCLTCCVYFNYSLGKVLIIPDFGGSKFDAITFVKSLFFPVSAMYFSQWNAKQKIVEVILLSMETYGVLAKKKNLKQLHFLQLVRDLRPQYM